MSQTVRFRLLGDIQVTLDGRSFGAGHARQRAVLAVLLVEANRLVSVSRVVDRVWDGQRLPADPVGAVRTYVSLLRRMLAASDEVALVRQPGGYRLDVDPAAVDLHVFHDLLGRARTAGSDDDTAALLTEALRCWHGEPFGSLDTVWFTTVRAGLAEAWRTARLDLADVNLRLGRHAAVVGELADLAAGYPLDERVAGQFMTALYRSGRQADALAHFQHVRERLAEELGADPSESLRMLHRAILTADPILAAPAATAASLPAESPPAGSAAAASPSATPAQVPADVSAFTGRAAELTALDRLAGLDTGRDATAVVVSLVSGTAGVGKTALAVHWAHSRADRFPDGQLYVNLRGYDPDEPMTADTALARFLAALGVPEADIAREMDDLAAQYRTAIAGRRMLVILDNAVSAEQVRPLLPGTPSCHVLVTSRDSLAGLVARDGAHRLDLDLFPAADAHLLLRRLVGFRIDAEPDVAVTLIAQCSGLPLALRVVAELASSSGASLAELAAELHDQRRRLDLLGADGDPYTAVTAVFSWSLRHLPEPARVLFRRLGQHPGSDFDAEAAAALAGSMPDEARDGLRRLTRASLIGASGAARYAMHDLLRAYAARLSTADSAAERHAGLGRLFDHYLHGATAAADALYPAQRHRQPRPAGPERAATATMTPQAARTWLDRRWPALSAAVVHAAQQGWHHHAVQLTLALMWYLDARGCYADAVRLHNHARQAARAASDRPGEAYLELNRGMIHMQQGRYTPAVDHLQRALALCRMTDDRRGVARATGNLGLAYLWQSRYRLAIEHLGQANLLFTEIGDRLGQGNSLGTLGQALMRLGRYEDAVERLGEACAIIGEIGDQASYGRAVGLLGHVHLRRRQFDQADDHLHRALAVFRQTGHRRDEALALDGLGQVHLGRAEPVEASECHGAALATFVDIGDRSGQALAYCGLGEAHLHADDHAAATDHLDRALAIYLEIGDRAGQARARNGLGDVDRAAHRDHRAEQHHRAALALATAIGDHHELSRASAALADLPPSGAAPASRW